MSEKFVDSDPYPWPYNGDLRPENTVFLVIDMQTDFCGRGGYVEKMGYDLALTRAPIGPIQRVLSRATNLPTAQFGGKCRVYSKTVSFFCQRYITSDSCRIRMIRIISVMLNSPTVFP